MPFCRTCSAMYFASTIQGRRARLARTCPWLTSSAPSALSSFVAQCDYWIDLRGAAGGDVAGQGGDADQ